MDNYLLIAGVLLNSTLIVINRFIFRLPDWLQISLLLVGLGLIAAGAVVMRQNG